jgi:hypothetical protein
MPRIINKAGKECVKCNKPGKNKWRGQWFCDDYLNGDPPELHIEDYVSIGSMGHRIEDGDAPPTVTRQQLQDASDKLCKSVGVELIYRGYCGTITKRVNTGEVTQ